MFLWQWFLITTDSPPLGHSSPLDHEQTSLLRTIITGAVRATPGAMPVPGTIHVDLGAHMLAGDRRCCHSKLGRGRSPAGSLSSRECCHTWSLCTFPDLCPNRRKPRRAENAVTAALPPVHCCQHPLQLRACACPTAPPKRPFSRDPAG